MPDQPFPWRKGLFTGTAVLAAVYIALLGLNFLIHFRLKHQVPVPLEGRFVTFVPGRFELRDFRLNRDGAVNARADSVRVRYNPVNFLLFQKADLHLVSSNMQIGFASFFPQQPVSGFRFDRVESALSQSVDGSLDIRFFSATGPSGNLSASGSAAREKLDVTVDCFLGPELVNQMPAFLVEHMFSSSDESVLKQIRFRAEGSWRQPSISFTSDLINLEIRAR